jgi:nucleoid-associated protein YgaU
MEKRLKNILKFLKINESTISTILGGLIVIVIGVLIYNYFTSINKSKDGGQVGDVALVEVTPGQPNIIEEDGKQVPAGLPVTYKVEKGDSLWIIAEKYYNSGYNWVDIAAENKLDNPGQIEIGQELTIPKMEVKQATIITSTDSGQTKIEGSEYQTVKGDYLWSIAVRAYGDGFAWTKIYEANKEVIGDNPSLIEKETKLIVPRE